MHDPDNPASIAILLFPDVEELDFAGPWEVFSMAKALGAALNVFTVGWRDTAITCSKGLKVTADYAFADKPHADLVLIPGGKGTRILAQDDEFNAEIRSYLAAATWQTSVCTGAALLARAGFLEGRQATTNRGALDFLGAALDDAAYLLEAETLLLRPQIDEEGSLLGTIDVLTETLPASYDVDASGPPLSVWLLGAGAWVSRGRPPEEPPLSHGSRLSLCGR